MGGDRGDPRHRRGLYHEINWKDGDVGVIDNTRIMHGRRAIVDPERQLFIGMGAV